MRLVLALIVAFMAAAPVRAGVVPVPGETTQVGIHLAELKRLARQKVPGRDQLSREDMALIERLAPLEGAVEPLVALLADEDRRIAGLAAATLGDAPRIDPRHLPAIRAGLDRKLGRLAPALARIPGDEPAREAVARYLVSEDAPDNPEGHAIELLGARAVPFMVEAARCDQPCGREDHYLLAHAFQEMGATALPAIPGLKAMILDPATAGDAAAGALRMLGAIGEAAATEAGWLMDALEAKPELADDIRQTLVSIRAPATGKIVAAWLDEAPDEALLEDIGWIGPAARDAGPAIMRLLSDRDADIRVAAARALGFIDYRPAVDALLPLLDAPEDLRLNWVAADSLGRLRADAARDSLRRIAEHHDYPPVREAANEALRMIEGGAIPSLSSDSDLVESWDYQAYQRIGHTLAICRTPALRLLPDSRDKQADGDSRLNKLAYDSVIIGYDASPEEVMAAKREDRVIEVNPATMVEQRESVRQVPDVALRVPGGWLAGASRGEWGGELMFVGDDGTATKIVDQNVENLHRLGDRYVAVVGLAHLFHSAGRVLEVRRDSEGRWVAEPWRILPGAPIRSRRVEGGGLLIDVVSGGSLLLSPEGTFRLAPCRG